MQIHFGLCMHIHIRPRSGLRTSARKKTRFCVRAESLTSHSTSSVATSSSGMTSANLRGGLLQGYPRYSTSALQVLQGYSWYSLGTLWVLSGYSTFKQYVLYGRGAREEGDLRDVVAAVGAGRGRDALAERDEREVPDCHAASIDRLKQPNK